MLRSLSFALTLVGAVAWSCPTCTCGNPALLSIGADQPFAGRVRVGLTARVWEQSEGTANVDLARLRELRFDVLVSYSPWRRVTFVADLPLQVRERTDVSLARERAVGPGEVSLGARVLLLGAEGFRPRHLVSLIGSVRLPTAPTIADEAPLSSDAQLGPGAVAPALGVSWAAFIGDRVSTFVSVLGEVPFEGRFGLRVGPTAQLVASAQFQPWPWLGLRGGVDARYEALSFQNGVPEASNQGALLQALVDVVVSPTAAVLVVVGARLPVVDLRAGPIAQSPILLASVLVDL